LTSENLKRVEPDPDLLEEYQDARCCSDPEPAVYVATEDVAGSEHVDYIVVLCANCGHRFMTMPAPPA
jgi:hypothetical protein